MSNDQAINTDLYLRIIDQFPNPIWRAGLDTKCNFFNKSWLEFTGRAMEQEVGEGWVEGVHPDDLKLCVKTYLDAFAARKTFEIKYRLKHNDGTYHWLLDSGAPFFDDQNNFMGYIGSCYDINESELAKTNKELYAIAIESINDGIWDWDTTSGKAFFTPSYYRLLGYEDQEFPATYTYWLTMVHSADQKRSEQLLAQSVASGESFVLDIRMKKKDGEWLWVSTRGKVIERDKDGKAVRMVGTLTDISDRKIIEEKLERELMDAQKLNKLVTDRELKMVELKEKLRELEAKSQPSSG